MVLRGRDVTQSAPGPPASSCAVESVSGAGRGRRVIGVALGVVGASPTSASGDRPPPIQRPWI